jgi:hypothetical protein
MTLEELQSLLDKARAQAASGKSKVQDSEEKSRANDAVVLDTKNVFLAFLFSLLWYIGTPRVILGLLESRLGENLVTLQGVIASDKELASELQHEEEGARKTLDELKMARNFTQDQQEILTKETDMLPSNSEEVQIQETIRGLHERDDQEEGGEEEGGGEEQKEEEQRRITEEAQTIQRQNEEYAKLKEQVPKLQKECRELHQTVEQLEAERARTQAKVAKLEAKEQEAERIRREYEGKTVWQKIWAWISWLLSCGSDD